MMKWAIIAISVLLLLLIVEEVSNFFWRRYVNEAGVNKEGSQRRLFKTSWRKIKIYLSKYRKDPSH
ncbi:hypothetical protein J7E71_05610 [Mesobacillus foraminis]|uniref:hypothetical protein n=1 Tax=Mesobacillus foraminis TaxID=279826 RepID=UPI001BECF48E|nr:hypothetical protein [Mesobacillus foraminis]MBT2755434.1 hypothetical protein [Mesobacillus foraminis]